MAMDAHTSYMCIPLKECHITSAEYNEGMVFILKHQPLIKHKIQNNTLDIKLKCYSFQNELRNHSTFRCR